MSQSFPTQLNTIPPQLQPRAKAACSPRRPQSPQQPPAPALYNNSSNFKQESMDPYWNEANGHAPHSMKYESETAVSSFPYCTESSLNFSTSTTAYSEDDAEYAPGRRNKTSRQDPLSHRIIEKRRRDRMNSCLADLSRLIPPQYQRKGRGRIEKTEIIEMAIRHLKHLQNECIQKENDYRLGYTDCMKEAAKFLYDTQNQEFCYRLVARLQEHCEEIMKSDCHKTRGCHAPDNVSASSGSPHQIYHAAPALCQMRDMLSNSDIEHSNDHNDVKDLSFRNHLNQLQRNNASGSIETHHSSTNTASNSTSSTHTVSNNATSSTTPNPTSINGNPQPQQAPVITSTAPASLHHHNDSTDHHDFESSREPLLLTDTSNMHSPPPRDTLMHPHAAHMNHRHHHTSDSLSSRLRNFSESSHDIEHNNNYKYKNHIKERFNHELHDEETSSEHCLAPPLLQNEHSHTHSLSEHSKDGTEPEIAPIIAKKRKIAEAASTSNITNGCLDDGDARPVPASMGRDEKPFAFSDIKTELNGLLHGKPHSTTSTSVLSARSFTVPIFALHGQGTYYVPLNVDYNTLLPFLNGIDLLEKNYTSMPVVHPININVNFMPPTPSASLLAAAAAAAAVAAGKQQVPPVNSSVTSMVSVAAAKAKREAITNGW